MFYAIVFLIVGILLIALGRVITVKSDRPHNHENLQGIKAGIVVSVIGIVVALASLMVMANN